MKKVRQHLGNQIQRTIKSNFAKVLFSNVSFSLKKIFD